MPISSIVTQPAAGSMNAAYRPVLFNVAVALIRTKPTRVLIDNISGTTVTLFIYDTTLSLSVGNTISFAGFTGLASTYTITYVYTVHSLGYVIINITTSETFTPPWPQFYGVILTINGTEYRYTNFIPPVVYCDVYIGGTYYKTVSKSQYESKGSSNTYWLFDIQDALQEMLPWGIGTNGGYVVLTTNGIVSVTCNFRDSYTDNNGFIQPETPIPIQATGLTTSTAGGGTASNSFFAVLATLQHAEIQDLATSLVPYQYGVWGSSLLPLSHRPASYTIRNMAGSDFYPLLVTANLTIPVINIVYQNIGSSSWNTQAISLPTSLSLMAGTIFLLGAGQKNLNALTALVSYALNFPNIAQYYLQLVDGSSTVQATTPTYVIDQATNPDIIRIHFLNYCGQFDAADFQKPAISHEDKSTSFQKTLPYNFLRRDTGFIRQNITSNDDYTALRLSQENEMAWLQELADSPQIFLEETRNQSGVTDDYLPLIKIDGKFDKQKNNGSEYQYQFKLQFKLGNEIIALRN